MEDDLTVPSFKVIIVGDSGVGKTTLARVFEKGRGFNLSTTKPTISADLITKTVNIDTISLNSYGYNITEKISNNQSIDYHIRNAEQIKIVIWDTAGTEKYTERFASSYVRGASAILVVFSLVDIDSLKNITERIKKLKKTAGYPISPEPFLMLVGTKLDLLFRSTNDIKIAAVLKTFFAYFKNEQAEDCYKCIKGRWFNGNRQIVFTSSHKYTNVNKVFEILATHLYLRSISPNNHIFITSGKNTNVSEINYNIHNTDKLEKNQSNNTIILKSPVNITSNNETSSCCK